MVTINDIAKKAGVAKSTVSRYLNNGSVSENTKLKLENIIKETGYSPNNFARSLKAQKTNMIGVIIPRLNSGSTNEVLEGIDKTAREKGYQLVITNSDQNMERELENIQTLTKQKVEGIIMLARQVTERHLDLVRQSAIPFLFIGQRVEGLHSIIHQDYEAGRMIGKYALELGHRNFLYVGVPEYDQAVGVDRKKGFVETVKANNEVFLEIVETDFSRKEAFRKALQILPETEATYIVCATDNIAVAFLKAAYELGLDVPEDFSLSGFGGYEATSYVTPSITTVDYPYHTLGEESVRKIHQLIAKQEVPILSSLVNVLEIKDSTKEVEKK